MPVSKFGMSPVSSPANAAALPAASSQTTLCPTPEEFCHPTVAPTAAVSVVGVKVLAVMQNVAAGQVPPPPPPPPPPPVPVEEAPTLPPHQTALSATMRAPIKPEIFRMLASEWR